MADARSILLAFYAGFAGILLAGGFAWKKIRDYREQRKTPKQLSFQHETAHKTQAAITR
jgi:hypothetical protein